MSHEFTGNLHPPEDGSSVADLAADPAVAASNIRRVRSLYAKSSNLRIVKRGATAVAVRESGKKVAFGDKTDGGEDALLRPATAAIDARERFFHKCATRNFSHRECESHTIADS